jgi:hypothetical protein
VTSLTPGRDERANLLLGAPLGRAFLAEFIGGSFFEQRLFESLGLGLVPGTAVAEFRPIGAPPKPKMRERRRREWTDVQPDEIRKVIGAMVARDDGSGLSWRQLSHSSGLDVLIELAQVSSNFGFAGGDEALWGLTALATDALLPVAQALVDSPATRRWWEPLERGDQRLLEWDDLPVAVGPQVPNARRTTRVDDAGVRENGVTPGSERRGGRRPDLRRRPGRRGPLVTFRPSPWDTSSTPLARIPIPAPRCGPLRSLQTPECWRLRRPAIGVSS